jgi:hypothetical protein
LRLLKIPKARIEGGGKLLEVEFLRDFVTITALKFRKVALVVSPEPEISQPVGCLQPGGGE